MLTKLLDGYHDPICKWWCDLASVAAFWFLGDDETAASFAASVESFPTDLKDVE